MTENGNTSKRKTVHSDRQESVPSTSEPKLGGFGEQVSDFSHTSAENGSSPLHVQVDGPKSDIHARATRLRSAAGLVGGARSLSERSGVPYTTLNAYLAGGEMKVSNAVALAEAAEVRLEWLLAGTGAMRAGEPDVRPVRPVSRHRLPATFDDLDIANLSWALTFVESQFGREGPTEARVRSMLLAANEFRRVQRMPQLPPLDELALADSLYLVEKMEELPRLMGRPTSTERRVRRMLSAYEILLAEDAESEEKPAS